MIITIDNKNIIVLLSLIIVYYTIKKNNINFSLTEYNFKPIQYFKNFKNKY